MCVLLVSRGKNVQQDFMDPWLFAEFYARVISELPKSFMSVSFLFFAGSTR